MKKLTFILLYFFVVSVASAQPIPPKSIEDSVLGWMKIYNFKGAKAPLKVDDKTYSIAQLSICDSLVNWMQASYTPKGGLGDVKKMASEKLGLYNKNTAALPQTYGAYSKTYTELKYNSSHNMEPMTNSHEQWSIIANAPVGIAVDALNTPTQYYFILPSFKEQGYDEETPKLYQLTTHKNTKNYFSYFQRNSKIGNEKTILLHPKNKFPFIKVTRGEYIEQVSTAIERKYTEEKKEAFEKWYTDASRATARKYADNRYNKRIEVLKNNQEKYKNRLQETAEIFTTEPDVMLENYADIFEGTCGGSLKLSVYKIDPVMAELCKKDKPQWIKITWHGDINNAVGKHLHQSILNNFDFDYLNNFFFNTENIKGKLYNPLVNPYAKEIVVTTKASENTNKDFLDEAVVFFEDFSTTPVGKNPIGWKSNLTTDGSTAIVNHIEGLTGNWVQLRGKNISAANLKKPLPQNFTLTYDLVATENFTWGAKGLTMALAKETTTGNVESFILIKLRPGSNGGNGEATLETKFTTPPGYLTGSKWYVAEGFSNNKKHNRISVTIKKLGEKLEIFLDKKQIAAFEKAIPAALLFNALSYDSNGNKAENDTYYISNIKILKD